MGSPYDILQVDPDADEEEIDRAYRRRVLETHPDQGGSVRELQAVRNAYERLKSGVPGELDTDMTVGAGSGSSGDTGTVGGPGEPEEQSARVEYLNYEIFADYGWSLEDEDLFEKAADAGLDTEDYGRFLAQPGETLLQAAENRGFAWPYACRGGACANCAVAVVEGELSMPVDHILPTEMLERGIRLSCGGAPITGDMKVVYNVKELPFLEELRLPPHRFNRA